jgi:hypothetical protein
VDQGQQRLTQTAHGEDYNSHNTLRLDVAGMQKLLLKLEGCNVLPAVSWLTLRSTEA